MRAILIAAIALIAWTPVSAIADTNPDWAARVKRLTGNVFVERGGEQTLIKVGDRLLSDDVVVTSTKSGAGLTFRDNSRVSVGSNARLAISKFVFEPGREDDAVAMKTDLKKGLAAFVSGRIVKRKPGAMQVRTPTAILGVRGTTFIALSDAPLDK